VTAAQLREVVERLRAAGHWKDGDLPILIVLDAGYDVVRLAFLLADLPVELLGRMRSDRVLYFPPPPQPPGKAGRKPKRGAEFKFADESTWPTPAHTTTSATSRYGQAVARSWDRLHPLLSRRSAWADHPAGELPVISGTVIRLHHLPGDRDPKPVWLWWSGTGATAADVDRLWRSFLRRFDLEHTFRLFKQTLGWTAPKIREPAAADRWTWLVITAHTQLRLARPLAEDLRKPWERPAKPGRLTPARVRRGFRRLHRQSGPRPTGWLNDHPPCAPAARRKTCQNGHARAQRKEASGLNAKLRPGRQRREDEERRFLERLRFHVIFMYRRSIHRQAAGRSARSAAPSWEGARRRRSVPPLPDLRG
jgi:DDE superfamily endonuclease